MNDHRIVFTVASPRRLVEISIPGDSQAAKESAPEKITSWVRENIAELPFRINGKGETLAVAIKEIGDETQKPPINFFITIKEEGGRKAVSN